MENLIVIRYLRKSETIIFLKSFSYAHARIKETKHLLKVNCFLVSYKGNIDACPACPWPEAIMRNRLVISDDKTGKKRYLMSLIVSVLLLLHLCTTGDMINTLSIQMIPEWKDCLPDKMSITSRRATHLKNIAVNQAKDRFFVCYGNDWKE